MIFECEDRFLEYRIAVVLARSDDSFECGELHRLEHFFIDQEREHALTDECAFFLGNGTIVTSEE